MFRRFMRSPRWLFLALLLIAFAVGYQSYNGRIELWHAQVHYCNTVTVPGALDAAGRDADLATFAREAANARRAEGQYGVAAQYQKVADRAALRAVRANARAAVLCESRFPRPNGLPGKP